MKGIRAALTKILQASLLWLLATGCANASHFIGGNMYHRIDANGLVSVTMETLWDKGHEPFPFDGVRSLQIRDIKGKTRKSIALNIQKTTVFRDTSNPDFDFRRQQVTLDFAKFKLPQGVYYIRNSSCCRIYRIRNVGAGSFSLENKIVYDGTENASPQLSASFITTIARGHEFSQNIAALDPDGAPMYYQLLQGAKYAAPAKLIPGMAIDNSGQISITADKTTSMKTGHWVFKVQVSDASGAYAQRDVMVDVVDAQNSPPVVGALGNRSISVGETIQLTVPVTDPDSDAVVMAVTSLPAGATFQQTSERPGSGQLQWTPQAGQEGQHQIQIEVRDKGLPALSASELLTLLVAGQNQPPLLDPIGDASVPASGALNVNIRCLDPNPGDQVTLSASFMPQGAQFAANQGDGNFSWTPGTTQADKVARGVVFRCTDNGVPPLYSETAINISVGAANRSPVLDTLIDTELRPGSTLSIPVSAYDYDPYNTVQIGASSLPANASFAQTPGNPANGTFTFTPTAAQAGKIYLMTFTAADDGSPALSESHTLQIRVLSASPNNPR